MIKTNFFGNLIIAVTSIYDTKSLIIGSRQTICNRIPRSMSNLFVV